MNFNIRPALIAVLLVAFQRDNSALAEENPEPLPAQASAIEMLQKAAGQQLSYELDSGHNVVSLSFNANAKKFPSAITDDQLAPIRHLTELTHLDLSTCNSMTDGGLKHISGLKQITFLDLSTLDLQGYGLAHLKLLSQLKTLKLVHTKLENQHLVHLKQFPQLEELDLSASEISDTGMANCSSLKKLKQINLSRTYVTDAGISALSELIQLKSIVLPSKVSDACLLSLSKLKKLKKLHLGLPVDYTDKSEKKLTLSAVIDLFEDSFQRPKRDALKAVGIPHHVTSDGKIFDIGLEVAFIHPSITNAIIAHCNECPRLERIRFHGTKVDDEGVTRLNPQSRVHTINLRGTKCSTKGLAHISSMQDIRFVTLPFTATDEGIHQLCQNRKLTNLIVVCPDATEQALRSIGTLTDLSSLRIDGVKVTKEGVHLEKLTNLIELQFNNANISQQCLGSVGKLVKLKTLGLDNSTVTDEGLKYFANLKQLEMLSTLDTNVTSVGRLHLFRNIQQRSKLATIVLEGGDITRNKQGQVIRVFFNGHHDESLIVDEHLELVDELTELTELVLYRQDISGEGFKHLARLTNLKELNLYRSEKLDNNSLRHLATLPAIERISLYGCESITDKALPHLKQCKALNSLGLRWTQTTKEGVATLQKALPNCEISGNQ